MEPIKANSQILILVFVEGVLLLLMNIAGNKLSEHIHLPIPLVILFAVIGLVIIAVISYLRTTGVSFVSDYGPVTRKEKELAASKRATAREELFEPRIYLSIGILSLLYLFAVPSLVPMVAVWGDDTGVLVWLGTLCICAYLGGIPVLLLGSYGTWSEKAFELLAAPLFLGGIVAAFIALLWGIIALLSHLLFGTAVDL